MKRLTDQIVNLEERLKIAEALKAAKADEERRKGDERFARWCKSRSTQIKSVPVRPMSCPPDVELFNRPKQVGIKHFATTPNAVIRLDDDSVERFLGGRVTLRVVMSSGALVETERDGADLPGVLEAIRVSRVQAEYVEVE